MFPGTPEYTVNRFANTMKDGNSDKAIDYICRTGTFLTVLPTLKYSWSRDKYTLIENDDSLATVQMIGDSKITERDWKSWSEDLQIQIPQLFSARITIDYTWILAREENSWCIPRDEIDRFVKYFIDEILIEIN